MIDLVLLAVGFGLLLFGAKYLVDSASAFAKRMNIPNIVIGLTVVAFGTSFPELIINVFASLKGNSGMVLGNVIGSNIFNVLAILGIASIIYPLKTKSNTTWIEIPLSLLSAVVVLILAADRILDTNSVSVMTKGDGLILLCFFLIFLGYNLKLSTSSDYEEEFETKDYTVLKSVILMITGVAMLLGGGKLVVDSASVLALKIGFSERLIGLTVVSIGTSLPELITSVIAVSKRNVDIAIGNVVGSNIFNVFWILGLSAVINPIDVEPNAMMDMLVNFFAGILLFAFLFIGKGKTIGRWEGVIFVMLYLGYMAWAIMLK